MATREKTIEFCVPTTATVLSDAVVTNLTQITVFVPEATPVFTSVFLEVSFRDRITATGGTITEHRVGCRLGAAGYTTITELDDITNTAENLGGVVGPFDFTTHFTTNWTGTSMTFDTQVYFDQSTGTTQGMTNVGAKLVVTYQYDDTAATQIKTVRIPIESLVSTLPTAAANFGTSQIPAMDTLLPEAGVVIRDYFFMIEGNEANANATDWTLNADIGGASAVAFGLTECALQSGVFMRWIYQPAAVPSTATTHNLRLWAATLARANHLSVTLYVTYQFTLAGTTRILNSVLIPIEIASPLGSTTSPNASRFRRDIFCIEPGTLTLRQSGFRINFNLAASANHSWRAGSQAYRLYTASAGVVCGMFSVQQRIDSGSAQGAGMTLTRGRNQITIDGFGSNTNELTNVGGTIVLNYESDVPSQGVGAAAKTIMRKLLDWNAQLSDLNRISNYSFPIVATDYWLIATGFCFTQWISTASAAVMFDVEALSGESKDAGYLDIYANAYQSDAERSCSLIWFRGRDTFKRFPQDADPDRLDIETARDYRLFTSTTSSNGIIASLSYHAMTWTVAGDISGHNASLTTDVKLHNAVTDEMMQEQTLGAGTTAFSFTVYDDTEEYYIVARQNDTLVGRSGNALAA